MMSFNAAENGVEEMIVEVESSVVQPEEIKSPSKKSEPGLPQLHMKLSTTHTLSNVNNVYIDVQTALTTQ